MTGEGIQNYVEMAAGLTKATRAKAQAAAKSLLATAGLEDVAADATDRATKLAEEVLAASKANRDLMGKLVATEVDKAAAKLGFVRTEELEDLRRELAELRMSMAHAAAHDAPAPFAADLGVPDPPAPVDTLTEPDEAPTIDPIDEPPVAAKKAAAKRAPAKKAAQKLPPRKRAAEPVAKKAPSEQEAVTAPAKKTAAKEATAKKAPVKKTAAKKTAAKKAAAQPSAATEVASTS